MRCSNPSKPIHSYPHQIDANSKKDTDVKYNQSTVRRVASFVSTRGKEIHELKLDFSFNLAPGQNG